MLKGGDDTSNFEAIPVDAKVPGQRDHCNLAIKTLLDNPNTFLDW
jgi:hypothetical protein